MSWLDRIIGTAQATFKSIAGDKNFLNAVCAATANVAAADGNIEDSEVDAALKGMLENAVLKGHFTASEIESAFTTACSRAKSRAGRLENNLALEAVTTRDANLKQAIFMVAADVADQGGIGAEEDAVLGKIAGILGLDKARLLAA